MKNKVVSETLERLAGFLGVSLANCVRVPNAKGHGFWHYPAEADVPGWSELTAGMAFVQRWVKEVSMARSLKVKIGVRGGKNGGGSVEASAMVDTGATDTVLPPSILRRVGVEVEARRRFTLADGSHVELGVGEARLSLNNQEWTCPVVFGTDEEQALLGATTLEIFNLMVDPVLGELVPRQLRARQI